VDGCNGPVAECVGQGPRRGSPERGQPPWIVGGGARRGARSPWLRLDLGAAALAGERHNHARPASSG
jgi:hypothetical protein